MDNFQSQEIINQDKIPVNPLGRMTLSGKGGLSGAAYLNGDAQSALAGYRNVTGEIIHGQRYRIST